MDTGNNEPTLSITTEKNGTSTEPTTKKANEKSDVIIEGKAKIYTRTETDLGNNRVEEQEAFYNPVMIFNRDISLLVIQTFAEVLKKEAEDQKKPFNGIQILDALAASGLRTVRFLKEIKPELINKMHSNDISEAALKHMRDNFQLNELDQSKVVQHQEDANDLMYKSKDTILAGHPTPVKYDVIDLDPYGTAVPFLDTAVQAVTEGGLLCVTCTDMKVLSGPDYHKCFYMYGVARGRMACHQESAIRIVLYSINAIANKYSRYIVPVLSYQSEHYLRVFVRVHISKTECGKSMLKYGHVYYCPESGYFLTHHLASKSEKGAASFNKMKLDLSRCPITGENYTLNGPLWFDPINDLNFVKLLQERINAPDQIFELGTKKRISAMLHGIMQQGHLEQYPLSVSIEKIAKFLHTSLPSNNHLYYFMKKHGFELAPSYIAPGLWKSNAPVEVFVDFIKSWRTHYCKKNNMDYFHKIKDTELAHYCLSRPIKYDVDFDVKIPKNKEKKVPMFFPNPEKNWGPKRRATNKKIIDKSDKKGEENAAEEGESNEENDVDDEQEEYKEQDVEMEEEKKANEEELGLETKPQKLVKKE